MKLPLPGLHLLRNELARETSGGFDLRSGNRIEILAGDYRTIRGFTLLAAIVDEACFFGYEINAVENRFLSSTPLLSLCFRVRSHRRSASTTRVLESKRLITSKSCEDQMVSARRRHVKLVVIANTPRKTRWGRQ